MTKPQINVTPLIDVLLVLLIIFMVITPTRPSSFEARVPREPKNDDTVGPNPLALVVTINPDSTLNVNHDTTRATVGNPEIVIEKLAEIFRLRTENTVFASQTDAGEPPRIEKTVFIKAPRSIDYGSVAKVVDAVKMAGAYPIGLQIDDLQ